MWSPDGSEIALDAAPSPPNSTAILVVKADGSGFKETTRLPRTLTLGFVWSPDGQQLAFTLPQPSGTPGADSGSSSIRSIQTVRADGSGRRTLTTEAWFANRGDVLAEPTISWGK